MSKNLEIPKIIKQIKFEVVWGELGAKNCFQRKSLTKYFKQTLASTRKSTLLEKLTSAFQEIFILGEELSTRQ